MLRTRDAMGLKPSAWRTVTGLIQLYYTSQVMGRGTGRDAVRVT
jgi:hypothetical protein